MKYTYEIYVDGNKRSNYNDFNKAVLQAKEIMMFSLDFTERPVKYSEKEFTITPDTECYTLEATFDTAEPLRIVVIPRVLDIDSIRVETIDNKIVNPVLIIEQKDKTLELTDFKIIDSLEDVYTIYAQGRIVLARKIGDDKYKLHSVMLDAILHMAECRASNWSIEY